MSERINELRDPSRIMSQREAADWCWWIRSNQPAVDPRGCKAGLDLHQHRHLVGVSQALDAQPLHGLSWCCHCAAISPISLIITAYRQLVFYPTINRQITQSSSTIPATTHSILLTSHSQPWACVAQIQQIDMNQFSFVRL